MISPCPRQTCVSVRKRLPRTRVDAAQSPRLCRGDAMTATKAPPWQDNSATTLHTAPPAAQPTTEDRLRFLAAHAGPDEAVECTETHMSWVFLAGDRVLKLKKPIRTPVLDFSSVAAREFCCREELRLNARLAPTVYLGLLALQWDGREFSLQPESQARDPPPDGRLAGADAPAAGTPHAEPGPGRGAGRAARHRITRGRARALLPQCSGCARGATRVPGPFPARAGPQPRAAARRALAAARRGSGPRPAGPVPGERR